MPVVYQVVVFLAVVSSQLHNSHLLTLCCPMFFVNSATKFFFIQVSPPGWCHPGGPPSDATESSSVKYTEIILLIWMTRCFTDKPSTESFEIVIICVLLPSRYVITTSSIGQMHMMLQALCAPHTVSPTV